MKILFISDIHGYTTNLNKIESIIKKEQFNKIVVLGDLYYTGPRKPINDSYDPAAVKEFLMRYQDRIIALKGNCDSDVDIKATDFPICTDLAYICADDLDVYLTHGDKYNIDNNRKFKRNGILVYGHDHIPFIERKDEMLYINPGSISLPRNERKASYLIYNNRKFTIYTVEDEIIDEILL